MEKENVFITYLESLKEDRGKLASLRRGLGQPPGTCAAMYPIVAVRLPYNCSQFDEDRYYLIASLFGFHPMSIASGNMGDHMRCASGKEISTAVERRFVGLLSTHWEDLPDHLRQVVSFLKSRDQAVNWQQLFVDLKQWGHPDRFVQRRWANSFWGYQNPNDNQNK